MKSIDQHRSALVAPTSSRPLSEQFEASPPEARDAAITPDSLLLEELALDSLDLVAVILQLQDQFQVEIDPDEIPEMRVVADRRASLANQLRQAA